MPAPVAEERFDWKGPAVSNRRGSLLRKLFEQVIPPKGHKVIPTGSGMLLIFIGLTIGLAAYNTVNNILFAALALLIAALILSGIVCWANLLCARWRLETSSTFRVGEEGMAAVVLENARQRFPLFCVSFGLESEFSGEKCRLYMQQRLDPGEETALVWRFKPERRMRTTIRIVNAASNFPFGFLSKFVPGECEQEVRVWPQRISYTRYRNPEIAGFVQGRSSKKQGISGELIGLRSYEKGDPLRAIHWKVSAKQGRLIVKQNATETQPIFDVVIDPAAFLWEDAATFEKMCSFAASLAEDLFLEGKMSSCYIIGGPSVRIQRVTDLEAFFDALADLEPDKGKDGHQELGGSNRICFRPVQGGVGAFVNEIQVGQA